MLVFATRNVGKVKEIRQLLNLDGVQILCLDDCPEVGEVEETGCTFEDNAILKAREVAQITKLPTLADDSGLEVDALDGAPGVRSARYAGPGATDDQRIDLLLENLRGVEKQRRSARFRCAIAYVEPESLDQAHVFEGSCEGWIVEKRRGNHGFGYDPVFYSRQLEKTFGEAKAEEKHRVSHRGRAMKQMVRYLGQHLFNKKKKGP
jgi:XTP/dITP diphosphohydrolase